MVIKTLFNDYVQKSRLFLYPLLNIKKGGSVTPIETYVSWKDQYDITDYKYICVYHLRNDPEFRMFEKLKLIGNPLFYDFKQLEENQGAYVFDFSDAKEDWDNFIVGHYSKLSDAHKSSIKAFFKNSGSSYSYMESYLHPDRFYKMYAELLAEKKDRAEMEESLKAAVELCDKPDWKLETLIAKVKDLEIRNQFS